MGTREILKLFLVFGLGAFLTILLISGFITNWTFHSPTNQKLWWVQIDWSNEPAVVCDKIIAIQEDGDIVCASKSFSHNIEKSFDVLIEFPKEAKK